MTSTSRRLFGTAGALVVIGGVFVVSRIVEPLVAVGTAYKAKVLCSEVFVAGRGAGDVLSDMLIDDLRALRWIRATVDSTRRMTRARFVFLPARTARYDESLGCALLPRGATGHEGLVRQAASRRRSVLVPRESVAVVPPYVRKTLDVVLDDAFAEPDPAQPRRTRAIVVVQHGAVVAERYAEGVGPDTPLMGWSMTKSVMNALIGVAARDGHLTFSNPVPVTRWKASGDARARISLGDLLHMSSGLHFDEGQADASSDLFRMLYGASDMAAVAIAQPLETRPGTRWQYSSGTTMILSRLLRDALGDDAYWRFPREALFEPLGMTQAVLEADASGTFVGSSYMYATAREWARFGQLYLQDGVWADRRILPEGWVAYTRTPAPAAPAASYGAHFWLATPEEYRGPAVVLPPGMFQAVGHEGQFVTVVPSHDVVIVRLGRTRYPSVWAHDRFVAAVLKALETHPGNAR